MSPRVVNAGLTGLVLGLLGLSVYQARQLEELRADFRAATHPLRPTPTNFTSRPTRLSPQQLPPIQIKGETVRLDWKSVESDDYATYVANLRAVGVPEDTIRDIIVADVDKVLEARRLAVGAPTADWDFWRHPDDLPENENLSDQAREREAELDIIERERRQLLTDLLGAPFLRSELDQFAVHERHDRSLQFLPEAKREAVAQARARYQQALSGLVTLEDSADREAASRDAAREMQTALEAALTPGEREQLEMRSSALADGIREGLRGFGATQGEFEKIFRLEKAFAEEREALRNAAAEGTEKQAAEKTEAGEIELQAKVRAALGEQRFVEYQRSRDPDYQTLFNLAREHQVSPSVAADVFGMRQTVREHADRVRQNPFLTVEQKTHALEAIRRETESAVIDVLGEPMLREYQRVGGGWLIDLTQPTEFGESGRPNEIIPPPLPPEVRSGP